jgi:hypothetical protein
MLIIGGNVYDPDLDLLAELLLVIDRQLASIRSGCNDPEEADALGYFDRGEHVTGLGFVACQAYMTATRGSLCLDKSRALTVGPSHKSGQSVVAIINHAANYWKHHDEWSLDPSHANANRIREAFNDVGFPVDGHYALSNILAALVDPEPAAFKPLLATLASWRDGLPRPAR